MPNRDYYTLQKLIGANRLKLVLLKQYQYITAFVIMYRHGCSSYVLNAITLYFFFIYKRYLKLKNSFETIYNGI